MILQLDELREVAFRHASEAAVTAIPRVFIRMGDATTAPLPCMCEPMLCFVLQGAKCAMIGDRSLRYDAASYFVSSVDVPTTGQIVEACAERPYLSVNLKIDMAMIADLILDLPVPTTPLDLGFSITPVTEPFLDAWLRMLRLLDRPDELPVLAPLIEREILFRLLQGTQGNMLRQIASGDSRMAQIRQAINWIRQEFDKPLPIEETAARFGMSASTFHRHFRAVTAMSPLQYQKALRLQQARRALFAGARDISSAAYAVGYESPSQFSREYARMFGASPAQDIARLRQDEVRLDRERAVA